MSSLIMPYESSGQGTEPPIVLVPGGLTGWVSWKPHAETLSKNHRVVRVQLLNMAAAEKKRSPGKRYSLRSETLALRNTLDNLGLQDVNLVGWSHGGEVSLDFALSCPDRIRTLALIEPATYWVARAYGQFGNEMQAFTRLLDGFHEPPTEDDLIAFLRMNGLVPQGRDPRELPQWPVWNSLKTALSSLHTFIEHSDDPARLKALYGKPVLLVKGADSTGFNSGVVDLLSKTIGSSSRVLVLPDAHACHIVSKDQFIAELERFVSAT